MSLSSPSRSSLDSPSASPSLTDLAEQELKLTQIQTQLMLQQSLEAKKRRKQNSLRIGLLFLGIFFFIFTKYVQLRLEYKILFDLYKQGRDYSYQCANSNFSPWHIALGRAHPWLAQLLLENPINQSSANFLWYCIYVDKIPTQEWLTSNGYAPDSNPDNAIHPLDFVCGNVAQKYNQLFSRDALTVLMNQGPANTPWSSILQSDSEILKNTNDALSIFITQGFYGLTLWDQSGSYSASDLYSMVFATEPPSNSKCNNAAAAVSAASSTASFAMMGASLGPEGAAVGGLLGLGLGLAQGFSGQSGGFCGGNPLASLFSWL